MWYLWVWFIWWSISHGFFTGTRSFVMAWLGIIIFLIAEFLKEWEKDYIETIIFWLIYSLAIGMVSGGFQHFLDSPQRSIYIIPIGFVIWYIIYTYKDNKNSLTLWNIVKVFIIWWLLFGLGYGTWKYLPASVYSSVASWHDEAWWHNEGTWNSAWWHDEEPANTWLQTNYSKLWYSWMQWQTDEAVVEHCKMMPSMKWCSEIVKSDNTNNINNTWTTMNMQHEMNHADMVNSEFDYIYLMIPHHQEAVDTSKKLLAANPNSEIKAIAENIVSWQSIEIDMMKWWLQKRYSWATYSWMWYMPMMRDTSSLNAISTIQKIRVEDMIKHHQWAIDMSNKLLSIMNKQDPLIKLTEEWNKFRTELRNFAQKVITDQTKEIQEMKSILSKLN